MIMSLSLLVMLLQMQSRLQFVFVAAASALLTHVQLVVHHDLQVPCIKAASQPHRFWPVLGSLVIPSQVQDFALVFVEYLTVLTWSLFQPVQVSL